MIQVIFCSRHLYNEKNEIDVSLELPTGTETVKRYMETAGIKDKNDLLISDYTIHELYAGSCGEYQNWVGADLNELNYLAERLEKMFNEDMFEEYCALLRMYQPQNTADMINLSYGFDKVSYDPEIKNNQKLGEYVVKNNLFEVSEDMKSFVDYNKVGELYLDTMKHSEDAGVMQVNEDGCICDMHKEQERHAYYDGMNIPDEYMILTEATFENEETPQQDIQN